MTTAGAGEGAFRPQPEGSFQHEATRCPHCRFKVDSAGDVRGGPAVPGDGDWAICFNCTGPAVYVVDGAVVTLRPMTAAERAEFDRSPAARERRRLQGFHAQTGRRRG